MLRTPARLNGTLGRTKFPVEPYLPIVAFAILFASIGYGWGKFRTRQFQNSGEARLTRALMSNLSSPDFHLLNHLTLPTANGTTQIDHVLVSRFGVFVIETKDYSGWIFAGASHKKWTQILYKARFRFQNPLQQNSGHVATIRELLDFLPAKDIIPIVVFTGNAQFKTPVPYGVYTLQGFISYVKDLRDEVMSVNRVQFCVGRLETTRLALTRQTDVEHIQGIRRRHHSND